MCSERQEDEEDLDPSQRLLDSSRGAQRPGGTTEPFPQRYPGGPTQKHTETCYPAEGFLRESLRKACCGDVGVEGLFGKEGFWILRLEEPRWHNTAVSAAAEGGKRNRSERAMNALQGCGQQAERPPVLSAP